MKVLVLNPPYEKGYCVARWESVSISNSHWYPIFLGYLTGILEKYKHECKLVDAQADNISFDDTIEIAREFKPDFVVMKPTTTTIESNIKLGNIMKRLFGTKIIFVGPWTSVIDWSKYNVDFVVKGEFEFVVKDIIDGKINEKIVYGGRLTQEQLDDLPWVTKIYHKHLNMKNFQIGSLKYPFYDMFVDRRKCYWGKCTFCLYPHTIFKDDSIAQRKLEDVLDEIEWVVNNTKVKDIFFQDGTPSAKRLEEISDGIIEREIKISWSTYARGDLSLTPEILKKMKKSGCHVLHVGCESASNNILKTINKGITLEMLEESIRRMVGAGINVHGDFMIGLPGETKKTIQETVNWAKRQPILLYQFSIPKPYPDTPFYTWLKQNNYLKNGRPSYPNLSFEKMEQYAKEAMKSCYFNFYYIYKTMKHPRYAWRLFRAGLHTIPWLFWRRWKKQ